MRVTFSTDARRDRHDANAYYRDVSLQLGRAFRRDLEAAIRYIVEYPLGARARERDVRAKRLPHFPYTILYRLTRRHIFILSVAHQARDLEPFE